jgi:hypothetical protein
MHRENQVRVWTECDDATYITLAVPASLRVLAACPPLLSYRGDSHNSSSVHRPSPKARCRRALAVPQNPLARSRKQYQILPKAICRL